MNVTPLIEARGAGASQAAHRRPMRRPSLSHVLIAVAAILAFTFNFLALQDRSDSVLVAVSDTEIVPGSRVEAADVRFVPIAADFAGLATLITEQSWSEMDGWVATRSIPAGGAITTDVLAPSGSGEGMRSMSLPISVDHAVGGLLEVGDIVDVVTVGGDGPRWVVTGAEIIGISSAEGGVGVTTGYSIVLAVEPDEALLLAAAIDDGSIEVVRSTGAVPIDGSAGG